MHRPTFDIFWSIVICSIINVDSDKVLTYENLTFFFLHLSFRHNALCSLEKALKLFPCHANLAGIIFTYKYNRCDKKFSISAVATRNTDVTTNSRTHNWNEARTQDKWTAL